MTSKTCTRQYGLRYILTGAVMCCYVGSSGGGGGGNRILCISKHSTIKVCYQMLCKVSVCFHDQELGEYQLLSCILLQQVTPLSTIILMSLVKIIVGMLLVFQQFSKIQLMLAAWVNSLTQLPIYKSLYFGPTPLVNCTIPSPVLSVQVKPCTGGSCVASDICPQGNT